MRPPALPHPSHHPPHRRHWRLATAALAAALQVAAPAQAHDTWFAPAAPTERGEVVLAVGTGDHFPRQDGPVPLALLQEALCRDSNGQARPLRWLADRPEALLLRTTRPVPAGLGLQCRARLQPVDLQVDDATVPLYLQEIQASAEVQARWATLRARGLPWQERYTKQLRIALPPAAADRTGERANDRAEPLPATPSEEAALPGLDLQLADGPPVLRVGERVVVQVLLDGRPLAGQAVGLRNDASALALWQRSDAQGRITLTLPLAARWLLRAVHLQAAPGAPDRWESQFATLAFEVLPRR